MTDPSHLSTARVLVAGNRETDVRALRHMLVGAGFASVSSTVATDELCSLQRRERYDLIVFDLPATPAPVELATIAALKTLDEGDRPSVLALAARAEHKLRALEAGARDFAAKPVEQLELLTRARNVLEAHVAAIEMKSHGRAVERFVQDLQEHALTDPLTELLNMRFMDGFLPREVAKAGRHGTQVAVVSIGLDQFRRLNDAHGHEAGDLVLRKVAALLKDNCRASGIACRRGGDEFSLVLPRATLDGARHKAEQIRAGIAGLEVIQRKKPLGPLSASVGIAIAPTHGTTAAALLRAADVALHGAKANGRNRVVVAALDDDAQGRAAAKLPESGRPPRKITV